MSHLTSAPAGSVRQESGGMISPALPCAYSEIRSRSTYSPVFSSRTTMSLLAWCAPMRVFGDGLTEMALMHRSLVRPVATTGRHHLSCPVAGRVYGLDATTRSGAPNSSAKAHLVGSGDWTGGGRSARL